jgi:hypothetical protein
MRAEVAQATSAIVAGPARDHWVRGHTFARTKIVNLLTDVRYNPCGFMAQYAR